MFHDNSRFLPTSVDRNLVFMKMSNLYISGIQVSCNKFYSNFFEAQVISDNIKNIIAGSSISENCDLADR